MNFLTYQRKISFINVVFPFNLLLVFLWLSTNYNVFFMSEETNKKVEETEKVEVTQNQTTASADQADATKVF